MNLPRTGEMRSPRAYLAAFGTSGSLLAVAALAFVFASAFVSFRGFPQVSAAQAPTSVTVTPPPRAPVSPVARRLSVVLPPALKPALPARPPAKPHAARPRAVVLPRLPAPSHAASGSATAPARRAAPGGSAVPHATAAPAGKPSGGSGAPAANPVQQVAKAPAGIAAPVVSSAGSTVGRVIGSGPTPPAATGAVPNTVTP
jgi:hypothetical protein